MKSLPGTLGALFARLGIGWDAVARKATVSEFAEAMGRCAQCPHKDDCGRWLASGRRDGYQRFCPNAALVERVGERAAR